MSSTSIRVLSVASECFPFVKTGGLADIVGALPSALAVEGVTVETLLPGYPAVLDALRGATGDVREIHRYDELMGGPAVLRAGVASGLALYVLDAPHLYTRAGTPYADASGQDWPDNALRFGALCRVAADLARGVEGADRPDVLHLHDWQAGLVPAYLRYTPGADVPSVFTIHNLAFQGHYSASTLKPLGLPREAFNIGGVEYYGGVGFLKAGLALSHRITTVSPTYAAEICSPEHGMGLDGLLRQRGDALVGILNGLDVQVWNPATDTHITQRFDSRRLAQRARNKTALQQRLGLADEPRALLYGVVSRLTRQKGMDVLAAVLPELVASGAQLALLGSGETSLEARLVAAAAAYPGSVSVQRGYDEPLAHGIVAGCDALLVPSRFEPCGLTQLQALRYGAVPVVARTGGLADTVVDANEMAVTSRAGTGIVFSPLTPHTLLHAMARTRALYEQPTAWRAMQRRGMATDVSWANPAARYAALYSSLHHSPHRSLP